MCLLLTVCILAMSATLSQCVCVRNMNVCARLSVYVNMSNVCVSKSACAVCVQLKQVLSSSENQRLWGLRQLCVVSG